MDLPVDVPVTQAHFLLILNSIICQRNWKFKEKELKKSKLQSNLTKELIKKDHWEN